MDSGAAPETKNPACYELQRLLSIMAALRDPADGCPWDQKQTFATIAPYTVEEAHEVADAIERGDMADLKDELGDLLLQVVYHSRMAEEAGFFSFADVARSINGKMIRRHPHVFGDRKPAEPGQWEAIKRAEREERGIGEDEEPSLFDGIPAGLPALLRSAKLQRRAAKVGFDWPSVAPIVEKLEEELAELKVEIASPGEEGKEKRQFEEFGDLMFVTVNLGLRLGIDAEAALRAANAKFIRRMEAVETGAKAQGRPLSELSLEEMQVFWDRAKEAERSGK